jgi:DNA-binding response OmpR family regulator
VVTVLIIDDEPRILRFVKLALKASGYEVITAETGETAIELVKSVKPDIIVLDIFMLGINGFQVLKEIRRF